MKLNWTEIETLIPIDQRADWVRIRLELESSIDQHPHLARREGCALYVALSAGQPVVDLPKLLLMAKCFAAGSGVGVEKAMETLVVLINIGFTIELPELVEV